MSVGNDLQEMENVVTKGAAAAEPMPKLDLDTPGQPSVEDLGGPSPENYRPDDDSAKLKDPSGEGGHAKNLKSVKGALSKEEAEVEETEIIAEDEATEEEVVEETVEETVAEELPEITDDVDVEEDVNALLGGQELSEEFRDKAKTIFEAALKSKVTEIREALEARYEAQLVEEVEAMKGELVERVDSYLEYVADEWFSENALVIEHGLKTEMTESFLEGMKGLFEEHYVTIPEDKYDVLESMVEKLDDMEAKLNEQIEKNIGLNKRLSESVADGILDKVSEGLATTQKEKLASLSESVEFESEEQYREKLEMLKESYFAEKTSTATKTETLSEGVDSSPEFNSGSMDAYLKTLSSFGK